eukprot:m.143240 g.143240  ORF g.143240 m.143240 type:complete len:67 (+) comp17693_c1_seq2:1034-1234(+)
MVTLMGHKKHVQSISRMKPSPYKKVVAQVLILDVTSMGQPNLAFYFVDARTLDVTHMRAQKKCLEC